LLKAESGAVRVTAGPFNTDKDLDRLVEALRRIVL
jgi:selenocysteine lyase/cysteine desulfurase